ncbi:acyltransferase family protein [Acinetobacter kookii]
MKSEYQPHIDILRALAVLLVIFNHLDFTLFSGGFIGVDVFFVISGYLITKNIVSEKRTSGTFSFKKFYQRRVLRLAPAFFTVLLTCSIAFSLILTQEEWTQYLKTVASTVTLSSNIYYTNLLNDYFSISGKSTPLLHIWSLSLEEQFYLIWPLFLLGIIKFSKNIKIFSLIVIISLSLITSHLLIQSNPVAAYYLLPSRVFEFAIGAALVFLPSTRLNKNKSILLGLFSILIIIISSFFIHSQMLFPSYTALVPCLAAALFISSGQYFTGLSTKWLEYIGKISYPMYLWHWPIIVYFNQQSIKLDFITKNLILILALILSIFSYEVIEKSIKLSLKKIKTPIQLFFILPALLTLLFSMSWLVFFKETGQNDFDNQHNDIKCIDLPKHPVDECFLGKKHIEKVSVLLVGDSHANAQSGFIHQLLMDTNLKGYEITNSSTAFLVGVHRFSQNPRTQTTQRIADFHTKNADIVNLIKSNSFKYVIMGGYFPHNWERHIYSKTLQPVKDQSKAMFIAGLNNAIQIIETSGAIPVLINDNPILRDVDINCHLRTTFSACYFERSKHWNDFQEWQQLLNRIQAVHPNLIVIDFNDVVCDAKYCYSALNQTILYRDNQHLTYAGSRQIALEYLKRYSNPLQ